MFGRSRKKNGGLLGGGLGNYFPAFLYMRFFFAERYLFVPKGFETLFEYETKSLTVQYFWGPFFNFGHCMAEQLIKTAPLVE